MSTSIQTNATSTEKSMEMRSSNQAAPKIDRLSLLPNELLDHIFDLAYSIDTPSTGALSKRLLPFHITGIYRRIFLTKPINIILFVDKLVTAPALGALVLDLRLHCEGELLAPTIQAIDSDKINRFFLSLTALVSLDLGLDDYGLLGAPPKNSETASPLPLVRRIRTGVPPSVQCPLLDFTLFPTLQSISVQSYDNHYQPRPMSQQAVLPLLTYFEISGLSGDSLTIASFCSHCPSLTHLSLRAHQPNYSALLPLLPSTLTVLNLAIAPLEDLEEEDAFPDYCDQELPRFNSLRFLGLDDNLFSLELPSYLATLVHLVHLELGNGQIAANDFAKLLSDPNSVPALTTLGLDLVGGWIGNRLHFKENGEPVPESVPDNGYSIALDWGVPDFDEPGQGGFTLEHVHTMLYEAEQARVQIVGNIKEAVRVSEAYYLEVANVAIYRSYRDKSFDAYREAHQHGLAARLPPLDLDSLDPNNLKLVKTDLPEEGWFALTLE